MRCSNCDFEFACFNIGENGGKRCPRCFSLQELAVSELCCENCDLEFASFNIGENGGKRCPRCFCLHKPVLRDDTQTHVVIEPRPMPLPDLGRDIISYIMGFVDDPMTRDFPAFGWLPYGVARRQATFLYWTMKQRFRTCAFQVFTDHWGDRWIFSLLRLMLLPVNERQKPMISQADDTPTHVVIEKWPPEDYKEKCMSLPLGMVLIAQQEAQNEEEEWVMVKRLDNLENGVVPRRVLRRL